MSLVDSVEKKVFLGKMEAHAQRVQPPRAPMTSTSGSDFVTTSTATTGTTGSTPSGTHSSDTGYGLVSLRSDCTDEAIGLELTQEEKEWLRLAHEFTATEKPFKEQKGFHVARKLRTWHPRRHVTWTFLRRLYNGRQDVKDDELRNIAELSIEEKN